MTEVSKLRGLVEKNPAILLTLSEDERYAAAKEIVKDEDARYAERPWEWAVERVHTIDEAGAEILPWPDKEYLHDLFDALDTEPLLAIPKSRRVLVSWGVAVHLLHRIRYKEHRRGYVQSEIEGKAAYIINDRMAWVEDHLPPVWQRKYESHRTMEGLIGTMAYVDTGSKVKAIAQGADAMRAYTPTFVFMDEIEFQREGHKSFVAALPFREKRCQIILASSSNGPGGVLAQMASTINFVRFTS